MAKLGAIVAVLVVLASCSSSSGSSSPNQIPGQCVLSDGVWHCGTGYGNYKDCDLVSHDCPAPPEGGVGACFICDMRAGSACGCQPPGDGGPGSVWSCVPTETGCQ